MIFSQLKHWPLRRQLLLLGMLPPLLMFVFLSSYFILERFDDAEKALNSRGQVLATQLAHASEFSVISGNMAIIESQIRQIPADQQVVFVQITDSQADVLLHVDTQPRDAGDIALEDLLIFERPIRQQSLEVNALDFDELSENTTSPDPSIGKIHVALSTSDLKAHQQHILLASFIPAFIALFIALFFARGIGDAILTPVRQLSDAARKIKKRNYSVSIEHEFSGEIGSLVTDINEMAQALNHAQKEQQRLFDQASTAREQAEIASQAKTDFLARMSHELRTPMNGVLGMLQLMDTTEQSEEQQEYTGTAIESSNHLLQVINDILDFSRIESGKLKTEIIDFDLRDLLENCTHAFTYSASRKGLKFDLIFDGNWQNSMIKSDPVRLRQIIVNLLSNAIKFTEQGTVTLRSQVNPSVNGPMLQIDVEDTGIGIPENKLNAIFDPFLQADTSTSRMHGGTGLGLSIASRLAGILGGTLTATSSPGQGSCFSFTIPVHVSERTITIEEPNPAHEALSFKGRVLVVEDNDVNLSVICGMLSRLGVEADTAVDGNQACRKYREQPYDCIFMDIHMPGMDGFDATRNIRAYEQEEGIHKAAIIALTADALFDIRQRCLNSGMNDYLTKPVKVQELEHMLLKWVDDSA